MEKGKAQPRGTKQWVHGLVFLPDSLNPKKK